MVTFQDQTCPRCSAPSDYLYANNGKGNQLKCKVCAFRFQNGDAKKNKAVVLHCPYCNNRLSLDQIAHLSVIELKQFTAQPSSFKVRYTFRNFKFDLKGLAPESPYQSKVDLSKIQASPVVLGLVLTYHLSARRTAAYNFLQPHEALDYQIPVSLPELQDKPRMYDKWLALIALAQEQLPTAQPA